MRRPDLKALRRRVRRLARRTASVGYRSIVVPLLGQEETEHALDLACRLAADSRARVVLVAPLLVEQELPLDAHFDAEVRELRARLDHAAAIADSYGLRPRRRLIRTRAGGIGRELAEVASDHRAELVVVGAPVTSRRGFRHPFPQEILQILRDAPCRVMVATGPYAGRSSVRARPGAAGTSSRESSAQTRPAA
ncbi:MAG TPA: universal stress protein [Gaiellaceae bacterium]|nr:universal stress protein [Gaiellaceae bacterium]